jgi:G3E family GTPase
MSSVSASGERIAGKRDDIRTPVTIVTGFLGSGKTTLMNRALRDPSMARTAVVINEFGEISIDHALISTSNDNIMVLENGCLCCTVFGDLVQTLNRLYHSREAAEIDFDRVIVETSGLADLAPVLQAFLSEPTLEGLYRVGSVIATVDAVNGPHTLTEHKVSVGQVALADHILITKLDLLPETSRANGFELLTTRLRLLNQSALISAADDSPFNPIQLLRQASPDPTMGGDAAKEWLAAATRVTAPQVAHNTHDQHNHDSKIASFSLIRDTPLPREALSLLLTSLERHLGPGLLRVKGFVNVAEEPGQPAVIQGAQHLLHNLSWLERWPDSDQRTRIVFITQGIEAAELAEMVNLLERVATRTAAARMRAANASGSNVKEVSLP